jgi:antitoxin FitA
VLALIAQIAVTYYTALVTHTALTIRKLDPRLKQKLRVRAAEHGRSMEEEAREILAAALATEAGSGKHLVESIRGRFARAGFVELDLPPREPMRPPPKLR